MRYGSAGGSSRRELLTTLAVTVTAYHLTSVADASEAEASTEHPMPHVALLGDSIFDNAAYVAGGPDVAWQLRERLPEGWRATLNASTVLSRAASSGSFNGSRRMRAISSSVSVAMMLFVMRVFWIRRLVR